MKKSRVTIKDIARQLGLSTSTVSRALKDHPHLKKETKAAVQALAKKLNYKPNLAAVNLFKQKTNTIGVVVPEITGHFFSTAITAIQDVVTKAGYNINICLSNESFEEEKDILEKFSWATVDGVLISPASTTKDFNHFKLLQDNNIPIVVFDRDSPGFNADKVLVDDQNGAFKAVEYLIKSGCKRIAHLGGPLNLSTSKKRLNGYLAALKKYKLPINETYIIPVPGFSHEDGISAAETLLNLDTPPDAIFAVNDCIATAAMHVAKKNNVLVPNNLSIVGFDDEPHSAYFTPSLSTVWQPVYSVGMLSARILLQRLSKETNQFPFRKEIFTPELVIRNSSKKP